jgi:polyribonucleotide nucleotidyltransferase
MCSILLGCCALSSLTCHTHYILLKAFDHTLTLSLRFTKVGLLIGPRGNTLKKMETESQAKIAIRGKGSVKEGKGRSDAAHTSNQEEDLHCLIMADTEEKVNKAKKLIHNIIETVSPSCRQTFEEHTADTY